MDIVIIEDEYLLAEELEYKLKRIDTSINVIAKLDSVSQSTEWLRENSCDLIFLDVHLSDGISFSIFDSVEVDIPVIFTTAYNQYSIKAFDLNSIAYLLKPVDEDKLRTAINKFYKLEKYGDKIKDLIAYFNREEGGVSAGDKGAIKNYRKRFMLNMGKVQKPVAVEDIAYFMADDKYLFAFTSVGEKFFCDSTLTKLEDELDPEMFFRVNRKFFVSIDSVHELIPYSKSRIKIKLLPESEEEVIISSAKAKEFKDWLTR